MSRHDIKNGVAIALTCFIVVALLLFSLVCLAITLSGYQRGYYEFLIQIIVWAGICSFLGFSVAKKAKFLIAISVILICGFLGFSLHYWLLI